MSNAVPRALEHVGAFLAAQLGPSVSGEVYQGAAPVDVALPCIVWHSQDNGGQAQPYIGQTQWTGQITIRHFANSQANATTLAITCAETLPGRYTYAGVTLVIAVRNPIPIKPTLNSPIFAAAFLYMITVAGG